MKHLLTGWLFAATFVALPASVPAAQEATWQERQAQRAEELAQRARERAERARERAEERARRAQERLERRLDRTFDGRKGAHIVVGRDYHLPEGSVASENVVVFGGDIDIDGHAEDNVVVIGGSIRLGPKAVVDGDVSVVGGELDRDAAATVNGEVDVAHISLPEWRWGWPVWPSIRGVWWQGVALAFTIGRFVLVLFLSLVLAAVAPRWIASIASRLTSGPGVSLFAGFAGEFLFGPAMILLAIALVITIIGIPLLAGLPLLAAGFGLVWVAGYTAVAGLLGSRLRGTDWYVNGLRPVDVFLGSCILSGITLFGQVLLMGDGSLAPFSLLVRSTGWIIEYIAWTIGLGAALTAWLRPRGFDTSAVPPVVPPVPTPSPSAL